MGDWYPERHHRHIEAAQRSWSGPGHPRPLRSRRRGSPRLDRGRRDASSGVNVDGEIAVVTGGASGIGRGTALALARHGADIVLADVNDRRLADVSAEIQALGRRVLTVHCDVSRDQDLERLALEAESRLGPVGLIMNNAGVVLRGAL